MEDKPIHLLFGHYILNLGRHLSNGDLSYVFPISAMLIYASFTHKYGHTKNVNWLDISCQLCATFVDSASGSQHVSFIELCA